MDSHIVVGKVTVNPLHTFVDNNKYVGKSKLNLLDALVIML